MAPKNGGRATIAEAKLPAQTKSFGAFVKSDLNFGCYLRHDLSTAIPERKVQPETKWHHDKMTTAVQAHPPTFDPLAPNATPSSSKHTFKTLERERLNRYPSTDGADHPSLDELVKPHIESFNALMEGSDGKGKGLLQLGVEDLGTKVVFDGKGDGGVGGNKISCEYLVGSSYLLADIFPHLQTKLFR